MESRRCCIRYPKPYPCISPCVLVANNSIVPLVSIRYEVVINGGISNVNLIQEYRNQTPRTLNISYKFPVNEQVVFSEMDAIFQGRLVKGCIKEKHQAKAEFLDHLKKGHTVAFAEQLEQTSDIMSVELGNFPQNETLKICFKYIAKLDVIADVFWGFRIPVALTPRYNANNTKPGTPKTGKMSQRPITEQNNDRGSKKIALNKIKPPHPTTFAPPSYFEPYTWEIDVKIFWTGGAKQIACPSHKDQVLITNENGCYNIKFSPTAGIQYPKKDFELIIEDNELFSHQCTVAVTDLPTITGKTPKYAAMMQFAPTMYKWFSETKKLRLSLDSNEQSKIDLYEDEFSMFLMMNTQAEFIFLLDRSGSMKGARIERAKQALSLFLRSLPPNCRFNVVSFGTSFVKLYTDSIPVTSATLDDAISKISLFNADLKGTKIAEPLQICLSDKKTVGFQRNIFLLTDGSVKNVDQIMSIIQSNCVYGSSRVFSVGIGDGCSEVLVHRSAKLGGGKSVIIADNDDIEGKIIHLLNDSITPSLTDFKVDFDPKYVACISPMPNSNSHITRGEPFVMYALLKNDLEEKDDLMTSIKVSYYDSVSKTREEKHFSLSLEGCIDDSSYHKMCVKSLLDASNYSLTTPSYYIDPSLPSSSLFLSLALAYQLLHASFTSFICTLSNSPVANQIPSIYMAAPCVSVLQISAPKPSAPGLSRPSSSMLKTCSIRERQSTQTTSYAYPTVRKKKSAKTSEEAQQSNHSPNFTQHVELLVSKQLLHGQWKDSADDYEWSLVGEEVRKCVREKVGPGKEDLALTLAVVAWLIVKYNLPKYSLIIKKGKMFLMNNLENWSEHLNDIITMIK